MAIYDPNSALDMAKAKKYLTSLFKRKKPFKIESLQGRSLKQNKKFHVLIGQIALETGYSARHVKLRIVKLDWCKDLFYTKEANKVTGEMYKDVRSSKDLTAAEMVQAIGIIIEKAYKTLGMLFPVEGSESHDADWLKMQREIEQAEKYL